MTKNLSLDEKIIDLPLLDVVGIGSFLLVGVFCYLVWVEVFAATLLMYYFPRHSTNAVIPGNTDLVDG